MKPYVICHMNASIDGRILGSRWRPAENRMAGLFERLHEQLGGGSWLIGRVTGSEYAKEGSYPAHTDQSLPRQSWFARRDATAYGIALDAQGKIAWGRSDIGGDPIVAVLTEQVFSIPGFGKLIVDAVFNRDYSVVQGVVLFTATVYITLNLLADLAYFAINPRMRG